MDKYLGKRLDGRYEISELVGVGGMANVYKAIDVTTERPVTVKILKDEFSSNDEFLRRFRNESRAIAVLSHPNIVKVYDVNFTERVNYIVMEYIDGITLKDYIELKKKLGWKEAVHFTVQILRALQHAHDKGIVHRDVKPQNIMLLSDGSIKVTDFGIARFSRSGMDTITDRAIGSVHYISPEQARGEPTDGKTDVYSVGIMLYEMLTGVLPFDADSAVSVALQQIQTQPKLPSELNPDIPEGLEEITVRAMQKDPRKRYQAASEMLKDIDEFKKNPTIQFEYQYLSTGDMEEEINYKNVIKDTRLPKLKGEKGGESAKAGVGTLLATKLGNRKSRKQQGSSQESEEDMKAPVIQVLAGITAAFVLGSGIFIFSMIRIANPFQRVEDVTVPTLVGLRYDVVRTSVNFSEFVIEVDGVAEYNEEYEAGVIFDQSPNPGRTVKSGSKIVVRVSAGVEIITLENYIGQEATSVFSKLIGLGLDYTQVDVFSSVVPVGYVVGTEPGGGSQVTAGTSVRVLVSMGPDTKVVEVPNLDGYELEDAREALTAIGLNVGNITYRDSEAESGTVIGQNPSATSQISEGAYVDLVISSGDEIINQYTLYVRLADNLPTVVNVSATQDGATVIASQQLQPSLVRVWRPVFTGTGVSRVVIYVDGDVYMEYDIDFDDETATIIADFSGNFG